MNYEKLKISLRYFCLGKEWYKAVEALEYAATLHSGTRKDGITPEFQHQLQMAHYVRTLIPSLIYPEETIIAVILHDTPEDKENEDQNASSAAIERRFGPRVAKATDLANKHRWASKTKQFEELAKDAIGSVVKGSDRSNNLGSMQGVFTDEKQKRYIEETIELFLPMLKAARRHFPQQEPIYENEKHLLLSQIDLLKHLHNKN